MASSSRFINRCVSQFSRAYATNIPVSPPKPPKPPPPPTDPNRVYTPRKSALQTEYKKIVQRSPFFLLLGHENFSVAKLTTLRKELAKVKPTSGDPAPAKLSVIRHAIFGAAVKSAQPRATPLLSAVRGPSAVLAFPTLDPPQLRSILRILDRAVPKSTPEPGASSSPALRILGAYVDGRVLRSDRVHKLSTLPTLETLRAQLVGLLSSPAAQLAGVLDQARGGRLSRTLEGLRASLEEGAAEKEA